MISFLLAVLLAMIVAVSWVATLLGMPGNWLMVAVAAGYVLVAPSGSSAAMGWTTVAVLLVLALVGELFEFLAGAAGAVKAGASRRGVAFALAGSIAGGILGLFVGLPVPVIGSLLAAILFGGAGAFAGAVLGERRTGRSLDKSFKIGEAAFWGRLLGTLSKSVIGAIMVAVVLIALVV
ncbi:MAG: DUF456 family protein [Thermoguttaceae bacterium]